jgi:hypothetical protein
VTAVLRLPRYDGGDSGIPESDEAEQQMTTPRTRSGQLRSEIVRGLRTLRSDPALFRMKVQERLQRRNGGEQAPQAAAPAAARPKIASINHDLGWAVREVERHAAGKGIVYGDSAFRESVADAMPHVQWTWISHRERDLLSGAGLPTTMDFTLHDVVVVGGADVKTAYLNALRWMGHSTAIIPVLWVGENFEYCGSTMPIPTQIESADVYLFHHFADFFPIKDPLLVRWTATDQATRTERYLLVNPQETIHFSLDELLPGRQGPAVVEVQTTHPALTGNRHPRWRVWADLFWRGSLTSLHGAHDYGPDHVCESRIPMSQCPVGTLTITLPNYETHLSSAGADVRWTRDGHTDSFTRDASVAIEELAVTTQPTPAGGYPFLGYRYHGHGTTYWYSFEDSAGDGRCSLSSNHEITVAQIEHSPSLDSDKRRFLEDLEERGFLFHPHALPILDPRTRLELGFSFEWANPRVFDFVFAAFDARGKLLRRREASLTDAGYHYPADLLPALADGGGHNPALVLISPNWKTMAADPQDINVAGHMVVRHAETGDHDVTEFQSCWRNLNATIDGFPHWLNPAKGVLGRTSVIGHVRCKGGLRTALLVVNASGNLNHSTPAQVRVRLHSPSGESRTGHVNVAAFTYQLVWMDELFDDLTAFLDAGYGTCFINSPDADVNCQIITTSVDGSVSLQHLWGY